MIPKKRTSPALILLQIVIVAGFIYVLCITKQETFRSFLMPSKYTVKMTPEKELDLIEREKTLVARELVVQKRESNLAIDAGLKRFEEKSSQPKESDSIVGEWQAVHLGVTFTFLFSPSGTCMLSGVSPDNPNAIGLITKRWKEVEAGSFITLPDRDDLGNIVSDPRFEYDRNATISLRLDGVKLWVDVPGSLFDRETPGSLLLSFKKVE